MFVGLWGQVGTGGSMMVVGGGCRRMVGVWGGLGFGGRECGGVLGRGGVLDHDRDVWSGGDGDAALRHHRVGGNANLCRAIRSFRALGVRCLSRRSVREWSVRLVDW